MMKKQKWLNLLYITLKTKEKQGKNKEFCSENPCFWKKDGVFERTGFLKTGVSEKDGVFENPGFW